MLLNIVKTLDLRDEASYSVAIHLPRLFLFFVISIAFKRSWKSMERLEKVKRNAGNAVVFWARSEKVI